MGNAVPDAPLTWDLVDDVRRLFELHFMVNAFRAGTVVAVTAGVVGWFMVLRRQSFAGHTLGLVGFPGAAGATLVGVGARWGFYASCTAAALVIAALPRPPEGGGYGEESAVIGTVQATALACGLLFVSLSGGFLNSVNALLFGSFLGITDAQVTTLGAVCVAALAVLAVVGRPLLFASTDADVAEARGVPVRWLSVVFLLLLGLTVAAVSQITGTLLVFALLVMPAAAAQALTARPATSLVLTVAVALAVTWLGLAAAYYSPYPIGFYVTTLAFAAYLGARTAGAAASRTRRRPAPATAPGPGRPA